MQIMKLTNDYDPRDLESFVQDIYDVNQFKRVFVKVLKPEGRGFIKKIFEPYPYQEAWTNDDSPLKAALKSRQVGFSFNELIDAMHSGITERNYKKLFTSVTQLQADELLYIVKETINLMMDDYKIPLSKAGASLLQFKETQSRLIALPSSDHRARSFHGDVFIDEIAHIPDDKSFLDSIYQITVREGYKIHLGTTPLGQRGEFYKIMKQAGWDVESSWEDVRMAEEFLKIYYEFLETNDSPWSIHVMPWWMCPDLKWERIITRAEGDALRQEYGMAFLDESTALLPFQLMLDHFDPKIYIFDVDKREPSIFDDNIKNKRFMGLDPAESVNQTALVVFDRIKGIWYKRYRQVWIGEDHTEYAPEIARLFRLWNVDELNIDGTGAGRPVFNHFRNIEKIPDHKINCVVLNNTLNNDLVHNLLSIYEAGKSRGKKKKDKSKYRIWTDYDQMYMQQLHQLRRTLTKTGKNKFDGKVEQKDDDIIFATILAVMDDLEIPKSSLLLEKASYKE